MFIICFYSLIFFICVIFYIIFVIASGVQTVRISKIFIAIIATSAWLGVGYGSMQFYRPFYYLVKGVWSEMAIVVRHVTARDVTARMLPNINEEMPGAVRDCLWK
jgi:hypothetical protein